MSASTPTPEAGQDERVTLFEFAMHVVDADRDGYYVTRWDRATPITVRAVNRDAAFKQVWAAMGEPPLGRYWTARVTSIGQVTP